MNKPRPSKQGRWTPPICQECGRHEAVNVIRGNLVCKTCFDLLLKRNSAERQLWFNKIKFEGRSNIGK